MKKTLRERLQNFIYSVFYKKEKKDPLEYIPDPKANAIEDCVGINKYRFAAIKRAAAKCMAEERSAKIFEMATLVYKEAKCKTTNELIACVYIIAKVVGSMEVNGGSLPGLDKMIEGLMAHLKSQNRD